MEINVFGALGNAEFGVSHDGHCWIGHLNGQSSLPQGHGLGGSGIVPNSGFLSVEIATPTRESAQPYY
ncbi:MAG: hypothetical protein ABI076_01935 [Acidobacteriaceae bacterium]